MFQILSAAGYHVLSLDYRGEMLNVVPHMIIVLLNTGLILILYQPLCHLWVPTALFKHKKYILHIVL